MPAIFYKDYKYGGSGESGSGGGAIKGYYNSTDGKFYEESTFETEITPDAEALYLDLTTETLYDCDGEDYTKTNPHTVSTEANQGLTATEKENAQLNMGLERLSPRQYGGNASLVYDGDIYNWNHKLTDFTISNMYTSLQYSTEAHVAEVGPTPQEGNFSDLYTSFKNVTDGVVTAINDHASWISGIVSSLATVATTGDYLDLTNLPVVPTKTSDLLNDSGFVSGTYAGSSSDGGGATKATILRADLTTSTWHYLSFVLGTSQDRELYANNGLRYKTLEGTASAEGESTLSIGNSTAAGTAGNKTGHLRIYGNGVRYARLDFAGTTADRVITLPDKAGTIALTSDIPTKTSDLTNDSGFITSYTDEKVKQTAASDDVNYEVLFSATADNTTRTEGAKKASNLKFNPSTGTLQVTEVNSNYVYPSSDNTGRIGLASRHFSEMYTKYIYTASEMYVGTATQTRGAINFYSNAATGYISLKAPSIPYTTGTTVSLPTTGGTLATQEMYYSKVLLNYACAALNTQYTVNLADSALNYDFLIFTSYQHTGGTSTSGRVGAAASIFPMFLGLPSNTAYNQQVTNFGYVLITNSTPTKATVYCSTNVAYGIVVIGVKFKQNN